MIQKEFIEFIVGANPVMVSISSISVVEKVGTGATIILKEKTKEGAAYFIQTNSIYYTIKNNIADYNKIDPKED